MGDPSRTGAGGKIVSWHSTEVQLSGKLSGRRYGSLVGSSYKEDFRLTPALKLMPLLVPFFRVGHQTIAALREKIDRQHLGAL